MELEIQMEKCEDWIEEGLGYLEIKRRLKVQFDLTDEEHKKLLTKVDELLAVKELEDQVKQQALIKLLLSALFLIIGLSMMAVSPNSVRIIAAIMGGLAYYFGKNAYAEYKNPQVDSPLAGRKQKGRFDRF